MNLKFARLAGVLYLIVIVTSVFSLMYLPSKLIVSGNALLTFNNIVASESLFRLSIASWIIGQMAFLLLPLALFKLLQHVNRDMAIIMVVFAIIGVPLSLVSMMNRLDVLTIIGDATYLHAFTQAQLHAKVMLALKAYSNGMLLTQIFWGLWLLPFGYLVFKSEMLPRIFGILLMLGCFGYLINVLGNVMNLDVPSLVAMPSAIGEIGIALWLLLVGARDTKPHRELP